VKNSYQEFQDAVLFTISMMEKKKPVISESMQLRKVERNNVELRKNSEENNKRTAKLLGCNKDMFKLSSYMLPIPKSRMDSVTKIYFEGQLDFLLNQIKISKSKGIFFLK
jgi:hypothetical protein